MASSSSSASASWAPAPLPARVLYVSDEGGAAVRPETLRRQKYANHHGEKTCACGYNGLPKKFSGVLCRKCYKKKSLPPAAPAEETPQTAPSTAENSAAPAAPVSLEKILAPLLALTTDGHVKKRRNHNFYKEYPKEFFAALFSAFLEPGLVTVGEAATHFAMPETTLRSKFTTWQRSGRGEAGTIDRRGKKRKLSDAAETLVNDGVAAKRAAGGIVQNSDISALISSAASFTPSVGGISRYKKRAGLTSALTTVVKKRRVLDAAEVEDEEDALVRYYGAVEDALNRYGADRIFNMDEKPLSTAPRKVSAIRRKGEKTGKIQSEFADPDRVYTAVMAVAANGKKLPVALIKKGVKENAPSALMVAKAVAPFGNSSSLTRSGWVTGSWLVNWLQKTFAPAVERPAALIWDGYGAHWTDEVQEAAKKLDIELIRMPPNRTDQIQPLDVGVFGALQKMTDAKWTPDTKPAEYLGKLQAAWQKFPPDAICRAFYKALAIPKGRLEDAHEDKRVQACSRIDLLIENFKNAVAQAAP